ncbi:hypothetical protein [Paenibacillus hubeiensis]|uniref:hypothetical protein n=1 Tax=Paenibacillus hubeiensis TaxID=3077330 RepID=UPI0031BACA32
MQGKNADEEAGALPVPEVDAESPSESPTNHPVDEVPVDEAVIQSNADTEITVTVGEPIPLPDVVAVTYTDAGTLIYLSYGSALRKNSLHPRERLRCKGL